MSKKISAQIVYMPGKGEPTRMFENDKGEVFHSHECSPDKINICMGWYSAPTRPGATDSLLAIEPYCILPRDYEYDFANKFHKIYTFTPKAYDERLQHKIVEIKHPSIIQFPSNEQIYSKWQTWKDRENKIVFIANNKSADHNSELYSARIKLADLLHEKSSLKVEWYAQIPVKKPYYKGSIVDKNEILTRARFSVCTENSYDPIYTHNYLTEKLPEVWISGAVPIYMGCYNIDDFGFENQSYIDLRTYIRKEGSRILIDENSLISRIEGFSEQRYNNYLDILRANIFENNKLKNIVSFNNLYETIINSLTE